MGEAKAYPKFNISELIYGFDFNPGFDAAAPNGYDRDHGALILRLYGLEQLFISLSCAQFPIFPVGLD